MQICQSLLGCMCMAVLHYGQAKVVACRSAITGFTMSVYSAGVTPSAQSAATVLKLPPQLLTALSAPLHRLAHHTILPLCCLLMTDASA